MGLVFLRHAYSRYLAVKPGVEESLPTRSGKRRKLTKEDFSQCSAIFLRPGAQFDTLVALPDGEDRARAIVKTMQSIETDYPSLRGVLPKSEYQELDNMNRLWKFKKDEVDAWVKVGGTAGKNQARQVK